MLILILDDDNNRHDCFRQWLQDHNCLHVKTAKAAITLLKSDLRFDLVCLDHDLDLCTDPDIESTGTGHDVARFISSHMSIKQIPKKIWIHSWNNYGAMEMETELRLCNTEIRRNEFANAPLYARVLLDFLEA